MAVGILSCGVVIPRARLARKAIAEAVGGRAPSGVRAVASHDEDSVTLMTEAALAAAGDGLDGIDLIVAATTTPPCAEKSSAALVAEACDVAQGVATLDVAGSRRAGLEAIWVAANAVKSGSVARALVCIADVRPVTPRDPLELRVSDGGCALVIGEGGALASIERTGHAHGGAWDVWRREGGAVQSDDSKGVREAGFERPVRAALEGLEVVPADVGALVLDAPAAKAALAMARRLGVDPDKLVASEWGDLGCATVPIGIISALRKVKVGKTLVACAYGDGAHALLLRPTKTAARVGATIPAGRDVTYTEALLLRGLIGERAEGPVASAALLAAEADPIVRLRGGRCPKCATVSYPLIHRCIQCGFDSLTSIRLARTGKVFTFTRDHLYQGADPVTGMAVVDLDGGGRVYVQLADRDPASLEIGLPVELVFRLIHSGGGRPSYSWKARPASD